MAAMPGELTFAVNGRLLAGGFAVSDKEVQAAMAYAFRTLKLVVEPGGAVALAAVLAGKIDLGGRTGRHRLLRRQRRSRHVLRGDRRFGIGTGTQPSRADASPPWADGRAGDRR